MHKIFVFGTLLPDPKVTPWIMEKLQIAPINGKAGFPISRKSDIGKTYGDIIEVDDAELARLDRYEGVPHLYTREQGVVITPDGERANVYYYLYAREKDESFWKEYAVERWIDGLRNV